MNRTVSVTLDSDFEVEGVAFRFYRDKLWVDGGESDDYLLREIEGSADIEDNATEVEITITDADLAKAREMLGAIEDSAVIWQEQQERDRLRDEVLDAEERQWLAAQQQMEEAMPTLNAIMTPPEVATEFGMNERGIRATCERGSIPARKSGSTWLIRRVDAETRWGKTTVEEDAPDRATQVNWLDRHVVAFILAGGAGDYDVNEMEPASLAEFMVDYWHTNAGRIVPSWFDNRDRAYCIEQLTESFKDQLSQ